MVVVSLHRPYRVRPVGQPIAPKADKVYT
jgi:hypothetical protein